MEAKSLLDLFAGVVDAVGSAVAAMSPDERRVLGGRPSQYALDLVADAAALRVLEKAPVAVLSEESGAGGDPTAAVTVVLDPIDGSTNCSRGIPYWSTSLAAVEAGELLAAMVVNHVTGERFTAIRGEGASLDGSRLSPPPVDEVGDALLGVVAAHRIKRTGWAQARTLGSVALELCEVAAGRMDGYLDAWGGFAVWDYLGGVLMCREAGVQVVDHQGRELVVLDPSARRQLVAAKSDALLAQLRSALA
ncbi:MAG TPA: inositol monophosphatase [Acidimicrobiia bacterium]|nr:inositol monophosphatase [Acidimicrobiia bacterium]